MTWENSSKLFGCGVLIGVALVGSMVTIRVIESPYGQYQIFRIHEYLGTPYYDGLIKRNSMKYLKKHQVSKTDYYLEQRLANMNLLLRKIAPAEITTDRDGVHYSYNHWADNSNIVYAMRSGIIKKVDYLNHYYHVSIDHENLSSACDYPRLSSIGPAIKVGAKIEGGQYLGRVELSLAELRSYAKKLDPRFDVEVVIEKKKKQEQ